MKNEVDVVLFVGKLEREFFRKFLISAQKGRAWKGLLSLRQ